MSPRKLTLLAAITFSAIGCFRVPAAPVGPEPCYIAVKPKPQLPEVVSVPKSHCPYALCLDDRNFAALREKLAVLQAQ